MQLKIKQAYREEEGLKELCSFKFRTGYPSIYAGGSSSSAS